MKYYFTFFCLLSFSFLYAAVGDSTSVRVFDKFHMSRYGNFDQKVKFPTDAVKYRNIKMKFTLGCLSNGQCEWDYTIKLFVKEKTGKKDSTLRQAPSFRVNNQIRDSINFSPTPTYNNVFNATTKKTDSVETTRLTIVRYGDSTQPLKITDTLRVWPVQFYRYTFDSTGKKTDSTFVGVVQTLKLKNTPYYDVFDVYNNYELGRFISPYAINFPKTFQYDYVYDVTDFSSLLHDSAEIRIEYQGYSYGFTATWDFIFVEGTPAREAYKVMNIYNGGFNYGNPNNSIENQLTAKNIEVDDLAKSVKIRVLITGHGAEGSENCAEFCAKNYYLKLNGTQFAQQRVWKDDCGLNALFPQPGTWIYDRANWCPGELVRPFDYEMKTMTAGGTYSFDMDMEPFIASGNASYNLAVQVFFYKDFAFETDAALDDIIAPTKDFWHSRYNPICDNGEVRIKNTGASNLTSATIKIKVGSAPEQSYNWTGNLAFGETANVKLPWIKWPAIVSDKTFTARVEAPNGAADQNTWNDSKKVDIDIPPTLPLRFIVQTTTNNRPTQNSYTIKNDHGVVFKDRQFTSANTLHRDTIELGHGCYTFTFNDAMKNGLSFFAAPNDGSGAVRIVGIPFRMLKDFNADFGTSHTFHFRAGSTVGMEETIDRISDIKIYPQPATEELMIENTQLVFTKASLLSIDGKVVQTYSEYDLADNKLKLDATLTGVYLLQLIDSLGNTYVKKVVVAK